MRSKVPWYGTFDSSTPGQRRLLLTSNKGSMKGQTRRLERKISEVACLTETTQGKHDHNTEIHPPLTLASARSPWIISNMHPGSDLNFYLTKGRAYIIEIT
ncbi:hypothetical protein Y032_0081g1464 [Ancylostoma ceylanicum]|uniref:Uncharacterized protein n=1 Tax=Ancylostoma ceylanicum TaxID=53326 RepID=A0A016TSK1_9BILA|nr:hypothetical protein Y032_0081g1464 [Ancylostoma ceylanicum]